MFHRSLVLAVLALTLAACRPARNPLALTELTAAEVSRLQAEFNAEDHATRIILLVSPT
jgi:ABC-type uncharacterized transport system auxiliary subunit